MGCKRTGPREGVGMVFGFGFNKVKILASAEKSVKQGKLQNAIADYEKVLAEDPKDLTVMNTVGDLYSRVGDTDKATEYFRKIGDSYAGEGFTVRAIAMYKKLTKQNPEAVDAVLKLGELYAQQGLYNDARAQYMIVAEHHLRNNQFQPAASVLQKTLELDPENSSLQARLAELYLKLGRAAEARDLYFRNAEALRARGALELADEALGRVLKIDPNFSPAMLARGQVKFDHGDSEQAVHLLEQLPDIDSRPDGLSTLLRAKLALGRLEDAEPIARKLLTVFNDPSGIAGYGESLLAAGRYEQALEVFSEHASVLLVSNEAVLMQALQTLTARVKTDSKSLEKLSAIYKRAGNTGHLAEVTELLAHAYVQQGDLPRARDLYHQLTASEPDNPQHAQNYKQIVARLAEHAPAQPVVQASAAPTTPVPFTDAPSDESENTFSSEEVLPASTIEQKYPGDLSEMVDAAITDAELFDSYNLSSKAIAPLELALPRVPKDVRVNQRLASLYARAGRLREAAERFKVLEEVHIEAGFLAHSRHYAELAEKYFQRARVKPSSAATSPASAAVLPATPPHPAPAAPPLPAHPAKTTPQAHEIDLSAEWEKSLEVEHPAAPVAAAPARPSVPPAPVPQPHPTASAPPPVRQSEPSVGVQQAPPPAVSSTAVWDAMEADDVDPVAEVIDEIRFYIAQGMWLEAQAALLRCETIAPHHPELADIKGQIAEHEISSGQHAEEYGVVNEQLSDFEATPSGRDPLLMPDSGEAFTPAPEPVPTVEPVAFAPAAPVIPSAPTAPPAAGFSPEFAQVPEPRAPSATAPHAARAAAETPPLSVSDELSGFVHELEASLGDDFVLRSPEDITGPSGIHAGATLPVPAATPVSTVAPVVEEVPAVSVSAVQSTTFIGEVNAVTITQEEERSALADIFSEFKESMESGGDKQDDPEIHYNLGVAFKEMDLFDEAIGEFQKVCQSIERGHSFSQPVQAFTWLADCFLRKGEPELAIRWYERALTTPQIDYETNTAIRYELGCACAAAGERQAALRHFMEVYGTNIDYRDVSERIKALRS
jgi:tetratricopeptide (TPR) repeat protein